MTVLFRRGRHRTASTISTRRSDQDIGPLFHGARPFGVIAERNARNPQERRFLLDPTRIGQYEPSMRDKLHEFEIAKRLNQFDVRQFDRLARQCLACSRMNWEYDRKIAPGSFPPHLTDHAA